MTRLQRLEAIEAAAFNLIAAIDHKLDSQPWPFKYGVPFGEAVALRNALNIEPDDDTPYEIPKGPR